jgi:hypothetical protein
MSGPDRAQICRAGAGSSEGTLGGAVNSPRGLAHIGADTERKHRITAPPAATVRDGTTDIRAERIPIGHTERAPERGPGHPLEVPRNTGTGRLGV